MQEESVKQKKKDNKSEIEKLNIKIKELEDKLLYKDAELINYRKRKDEEVSNMLKYSNNDIILELLSIIDDFERAIKFDDNVLTDELSKFLEGFKMIYGKLINILNSCEVREIDSLNKPFNSNYDHAVMTRKVEGIDAGIVIEVLQKGYMYKDRVIRPTMVVVSE